MMINTKGESGTKTIQIRIIPRLTGIRSIIAKHAKQKRGGTRTEAGAHYHGVLDNQGHNVPDPVLKAS